MPTDSGTPLVSVIIPVYNATHYIPEALNCLRAQTFRDFEVILTNDGCPDTENLEFALEPYWNEVRYLKSGQHASAAGSRNNAINASSAKYIALLDADDLWEPDYLKVHVEFLESHPEYDLVHSNAVMFGDTGWSGRIVVDPSVPASETTLHDVVLEKRLVYVAITARRESLLRAGLFDPEVWGGEDRDLWMRLMRIGGRLWYTGQLLCRYRFHLSNQGTHKLRSFHRHIAMFQKHLNLPGLTEEQAGWFEESIRNVQAQIDLYEGKQALYHKERAKAIELLKKANAVMHSGRITMAILGLQVAPGLLYSYVHRKFPTEYTYLH